MSERRLLDRLPEDTFALAALAAPPLASLWLAMARSRSGDTTP